MEKESAVHPLLCNSVKIAHPALNAEGLCGQTEPGIRTGLAVFYQSEATRIKLIPRVLHPAQ